MNHLLSGIIQDLVVNCWMWSIAKLQACSLSKFTLYPQTRKSSAAPSSPDTLFEFEAFQWMLNQSEYCQHKTKWLIAFPDPKNPLALENHCALTKNVSTDHLGQFIPDQSQRNFEVNHLNLLATWNLVSITLVSWADWWNASNYQSRFLAFSKISTFLRGPYGEVVR